MKKISILWIAAVLMCLLIHASAEEMPVYSSVEELTAAQPAIISTEFGTDSLTVVFDAPVREGTVITYNFANSKDVPVTLSYRMEADDDTLILPTGREWNTGGSVLIKYAKGSENGICDLAFTEGNARVNVIQLTYEKAKGAEAFEPLPGISCEFGEESPVGYMNIENGALKDMTMYYNISGVAVEMRVSYDGKVTSVRIYRETGENDRRYFRGDIDFDFMPYQTYVDEHMPTWLNGKKICE